MFLLRLLLAEKHKKQPNRQKRIATRIARYIKCIWRTPKMAERSPMMNGMLPLKEKKVTREIRAMTDLLLILATTETGG